MSEAVPETQQLLTLDEVVERLRITRATLYAKLLDQPDGISTVRVSRRRFVLRSELDDYFRRITQKDGTT